MGVVTVSSSASGALVGFNSKFSTSKSVLKRPLIVALRADNNNSTALLTRPEQTQSPVETYKKHQKKLGNGSKSSRKAVLTDEVSPCSLQLDYNDAAAKLENIFKLNSTPKTSDVEDVTGGRRKGRKRKKKTAEGDEKEDNEVGQTVVRNRKKKEKRLSLDRRITLKHNKDNEVIASVQKKKSVKSEEEKIERLVRDYSASTDLVSLDWKKMKIPPVLPSTEHAWLFKLMQPMKALSEVNENLKIGLGREPAEAELADATKMTVAQVRRHLEVGRAARNKLIKHNLRLILFVINKYFQDFSNGPKFQDLCQAGVKGLITAVDRFEPNRKLRLSTYSLFWIRHAIIRSMTVSSFTRVSFGLESVRAEIQRAKLELLFELHRMPTEEEIIERVGISPERYHEVKRASRPVISLHSRHSVTQEEFISGITDVDGVGGDDKRQTAILRLALDDVLDSLKPKESLVIRQRYGLDGKGDRTLGEIAGNLNISREMVRKYEVKALMKLKHPARVDYLRRLHADNLNLDSDSTSGPSEPVIDELNGSVTGYGDKFGGEDNHALKLVAEEGVSVEPHEDGGENFVESGGEGVSLSDNEVRKGKIRVMVFLVGVWAMLNRWYERLLETDWLSWLPFWRQGKRLERLIAKADANPKDAAKQSALLAEINKYSCKNGSSGPWETWMSLF